MAQKEADSGTRSQIVPWIVFLFSISIVLISFISVIFPALILASDTLKIPGIQSVTPDPFETGVWFGGTIVTSIIVFSLVFLHHKKKIPSLSRLFEKIFAFEISKKTTLIIMIVLLGIYISVSVTELTTQEDFEDYALVKERLDEAIRDNRWTIEDAINGNPNYPTFEPHVRYTLLLISEKIFGNLKIIPFLASIALLITTYLITKIITHKRFAGIVSTVILLQSSVFLAYDTTVSYTNFWILFYLISLYTIYRFWPLSPIAYLISIPAKSLTILFLPMSIYFILKSNISKNKKIVITSSMILIIAIIGVVAVSGDLSDQVQEEFNSKEFWMGFTSFAYQLRFDGLIMLFLIPLIVGLFIASKKGIKHAESFMILIAGILLIAPILTGFTNQTNQPYRFVPLVVFFAIGVGVLLSKKS